jgi:tRNA modification GTPase
MNNDTIVALATGRGGAIAVIRVSGPRAITLTDRLFAARNGVRLEKAPGYSVHFGEIREQGGVGDFGGAEVSERAEVSGVSGGSDRVVDQVIVTLFRASHSYTGEDVVEISCHASPYIENRIIQLLITSGARAATPGEFTVRAFLAGKMDLAQAEAVADLISASGKAQHTLAMSQMKGGVSSALARLREELVELAALLELELDFGEEEVEFASRDTLRQLAGRISDELTTLAESFELGNAIRQGVPVAIVGRPNAGKSTLLNALAGDDRAMVSEIAGTTRDRIEERVNISGVGFRLIDTAGLRDTEDPLEKMGIDRAREAVRKALIVLLLIDAAELARPGVGRNGAGRNGVGWDGLESQIADLELRPDQRLCVVVNKIDKLPESAESALSGTGEEAGTAGAPRLAISAKTGEGLEGLRRWLLGAVDTGALEAGAAVISTARHHEALTRATEAIRRVSGGLETGIPADLLAEDIREVSYHLGTITGTITTGEILSSIFSKFCIGK